MSEDQGVEFRLFIEDLLDQPGVVFQTHVAAVFRAFDGNEFIRLDVAAVGVFGRHNEAVFRTDGAGAVGAGEEFLAVGAAGHVADGLADGKFFHAGLGGSNLCEGAVAVRQGFCNFVIGKIVDTAEEVGVAGDPCGVIVGFKPAESIGKGGAADHCSVVFKQERLVTFGKFRLDLVPEDLGAGAAVTCHAGSFHNIFRAGDDAHAGNDLCERPGNQHGGVRMNNSAGFRTGFVDPLMERIFAGGFVLADNGTVCLDAHDVCRSQGPLVNAAGADPHVAVFVQDREVAAAGGGHAVVIDPFHVADDLVRRMFVVDSAHV